MKKNSTYLNLSDYLACTDCWFWQTRSTGVTVAYEETHYWSPQLTLTQHNQCTPWSIWQCQNKILSEMITSGHDNFTSNDLFTWITGTLFYGSAENKSSGVLQSVITLILFEVPSSCSITPESIHLTHPTFIFILSTGDTLGRQLQESSKKM